jgi:hypothetical protein
VHHHLDVLPPRLAPVLGLGQLSQVADEVRGSECHELVGLVATGVVTREPHPSDRRATLVTFTERGHVTAQALLDDHRRLARQLFAGMAGDVFGSFDAGLRARDRMATFMAIESSGRHPRGCRWHGGPA